MAKIGILGGGIAGLAQAYYLSKHHEVSLFEAESRVGGWVETTKVEGFFFEGGPRSFRTRGKGKSTLRLVSELGLEKELLPPSPEAKMRYLLHDAALYEVPASLSSFLTSPLTKGIKKAILFGLFQAPTIDPEASVFAFFEKKFSTEFAHRFIDPLCRGIFGGSAKKLSFAACFPEWIPYLKKAFFPSLLSLQKKEMKEPFFSFKKGMETLPKALFERLSPRVHLEKRAISIREEKKEIALFFEDGTSDSFDRIYSTLPLFVLSDLIAYPRLLAMPYLTITILHLGYKQEVLAKKGFGYLAPSRSEDKILGTIFDSSIFPAHNTFPKETRISIMVEGELPHEKARDFAKAAASLHLGIKEEEDFFSIRVACRAIPQYFLGSCKWKIEIKENILKNFSRLIPAGTALSGVGINDAISFAESLQKKESPF